MDLYTCSLQVILIGDSIISRLPHSTNNFETRYYRGAHIDKIEHLVFSGEIDELLKPARNIIIAFGTNNLQTNNTHEIVKELIFGAQLIQSKFRKANVYIATIIRRRDNDQLDRKIPIINQQITKKCRNLGIGTFDINTTFEHKKKPADPKYYYDGLHLSAFGLKKYQHTLNNFIHILEGK